MLAASSKSAIAGGGMVDTQSSSSTEATISSACVSVSAQAPISTRASNSAAGVPAALMERTPKQGAKGQRRW